MSTALGEAAAQEADEDAPIATKNPMMMYAVVKELSRISPGFAMGFGVSLGLVGGAIVAKSTPDQIERWGLPLSTLEQIGAWWLTEPGAGSDAFGSMRTTAVPDGDGYALSGQKTFITNGPGADVFLVYAKIDRGEPPDARGVGAFIVERGAPGVTVGPPFKKMGMRDSPTSEVFSDGVRLGREHLLGGREKGRAGRGVIRTDDAVLRNTVIPRTKIAGLSIEASTGQADTGLVNGDEILPIVYGIHSSRNLINPADENEKPGFLPGVRYVGERDGPGWFIFALGTLKREGMVIYPVGKASELQFGVHNGVQATHVRYDDAVTDEEARLDAAGYTQDMGGSFGSAVTYTTAAGVTILNPVDQLRHLRVLMIFPWI